ncbi:HDIG domain-containing protein [Candidatus Woesearchaeota archaeon]|nr:HDIG domain-containing protein [Candidatus Woesearchaeota archaeon]
MAIPSRRQCLELLWHHNVPKNIISHSLAVSRVALGVAGKLAEKGRRIDFALLDAACILHDIGKMQAVNDGGRHEEIGASIVARHGFSELAAPIRRHPLHYILSKDAPRTIVEKLVFYADKRVMHDRVVSLKTRLADLKKRYPQYTASIDEAAPKVFLLEKELCP